MDVNIPNWNNYFMNIAEAVSLRSKDPCTKVGSVIIDENKHIIATGFNGFPPGMEETEEMWRRPNKYNYVTHAESNSIVNSTKPCKNGTLYTTLFPCNECAKLIASCGIKEVYYRDDKYDNELTRFIFHKCSINLTKI